LNGLQINSYGPLRWRDPGPLNPHLTEDMRSPYNLFIEWYNRMSVAWPVTTRYPSHHLQSQSLSNITVIVGGSNMPGSPLRPVYRAEPILNLTMSLSLRHRTPTLFTTYADTQPAMIWHWAHLADRFGNVESIPPAYADDVVMSDIVLRTDFSKLVRRPDSFRLFC
jgi:hypothetical protein